MRYILVFLLATSGFLWWQYRGMPEPVQVPDTPLMLNEILPLSLLPEGQKMERVPFDSNPPAPAMNSACPVEESVVIEAAKRNRDIGFQGEAKLRPWHDIEQRLLGGHASFDEWKHTIRKFLVLYTQLTNKLAPSNLGISEAADILDSVKYAICDEVAIIHFLVEKGIDPVVGQEWEEAPKIALTPEERSLLEVLYRSCRMTAEHIIHQQASRLARITFAPTAEDWATLQKAFDIDPRRGEEIICTYRPLG